MTHWLDSNQKITQTLVHKNGKSIYYTREKDTISSVFEIKCTNIKFQFLNNKINQVYFYQEPEGKIYPLELFPVEKEKLQGFVWDIENKPSRSYFGAQFIPIVPKSMFNLNIRKTQTQPKKSKKNKKDKK
jgi:hypothetical protein